MATEAITTLFKRTAEALAVEVTPDLIKSLTQADDTERKRQKECVLARKFHEGAHAMKLSERMREYLGTDIEFSINFMSTVTLAVAERLLVKELKCDAETPEAQVQEDWWRKAVWNGSRLQSKQADIVEVGLTEGEYFVLIDWDGENNRPRLTPHQRYTDPDIGGDGEGVRLIYPGGDTDQKPLYGYKRWTETALDGKKTDLMELFLPDRAQLYVRGPRGWELEEEVPLINPRTGLPLGIPIVHFKTPMLRPEAKAGWAVQRLINKLVTDFMETSDQTAFRIWLFFGWSPTDKDGNPLRIQPGTWLGTDEKNKEEASAQAVEGADLSGQDDTLSNYIMRLAIITHTPIERFQVTRQIAAEGTLKQQNEPLLKKVERRAASYSNSWQDLARIARRWHNAWCDFGQSEFSLLDESLDFVCEWEPFFSRSAEEETAIVGVDQAKLNLVAAKHALGIISLQQAALEVGYTEEEFRTFQAQRQAEQTTVADNMNRMFNAGDIQ